MSAVMKQKPSEIAKVPWDELYFWYWWTKRTEDKQNELWLRALGVHWNKTDLLNLLKPDNGGPASEEVFTPLAFVVNPKMQEWLKDHALRVKNQPHNMPPDEIRPMTEKDRNTFIQDILTKLDLEP